MTARSRRLLPNPERGRSLLEGSAAPPLSPFPSLHCCCCCPSVPPFGCTVAVCPSVTPPSLSVCLCVSLSSQSSGTHKPKDPPWLALVQTETKKKKAPAPPPASLATPPNSGSLSSLKGEGSRPGTPPPPANPFDEDEEEDGAQAAEEEGGALPASHPWYSITRAADATAADTPPSGGSSSRSVSPGNVKGKKRLAPRAPPPPGGSQGQCMEQLLNHSSLSKRV